MTRFTFSALFIALIAVLGSGSLSAQRITVTLAGNGSSGFNGDGRPGHLTNVSSPTDVCRDIAGNVYFTEGGGAGRVRMYSAKTGIISTVAGGGTSMAEGIPATDALLLLSNICIDAAGNLYVVNTPGAIRQINMSTGIINTITATGTTIHGICADASGNILFVDNTNNQIKKVSISTGVITVLAGTGTSGYTGDGGLATLATLASPFSICTNPAGEIIFDDQGGMESVIRKIDLSGNISTIAGTTIGTTVLYDVPALSCWLGEVTGLCTDDTGNIFCNEVSCSCRKIRVSCDSIFQVGGNFYDQGYSDNVNSNLSNMNTPYGLCSAPGGTVYIADQTNNRIRKVIQLSATPTFAFGEAQSINPCSGNAFSLDSQLSITDINVGETETWSVLSAPVNGTLAGFPATGTSVGVTSIVLPSGVTYTTPSSFTGTDSFKVLVSDGTYSDIVTIYVTVQPGTAGTISGTTDICPSSSATLLASVPGGIWSASNANASIDASTGAVVGVVVGFDTVIYTVYASCYISTSTVVTIHALPAAGVISGPAALCAGASTSLTESVPGGVWSTMYPAYATVSSGGVLTGLSYGTDDVEYTTSNAWCSAVAYKYITINSAVTDITGTPSLCIGTSYPFYDGFSGGIWTSSNTNASVDVSGNVTGVSSGAVTISYTNTGTCGTATAVYPLTIYVSPDAGSISGPSSVCTGATIPFAATVAGGSWSDLTGYASVDPVTGIVTGTFAGTDSIVYTVTSGGCSSEVEAFVTIATAPDPGIISGLSTLCAGSSFTLTETVAGGTWSVSGTGASVSGTGVVTGTGVGSPSVLYGVTNSCGTAYASWPLTVNPLPDAGTISGLSAVCPGSLILLTDASAGGTWSASNANATVSGTGTVAGIYPGTDSVLYTVTNSCGTTSAFRLVTIENCSLGLAAAQAGQELQIFPNPANDVLNISWVSSLGNVTIVIRDIAGREMSRTSFDGSAGIGEVKLSLTDLKTGIYTMNVKTDLINYTEKLEVIR